MTETPTGELLVMIDSDKATDLSVPVPGKDTAPVQQSTYRDNIKAVSLTDSPLDLCRSVLARTMD